MLAITFALLFLYWVLRTVLCNPSPFMRVAQIILAAVSLGLFLVLPKAFFWQPFLLIGIALSFSFFKHLKKQKPAFHLSAMFGWGFLYLMGSVVALISVIFQYHQDQVVGHVVLKGHDQSTWMSWKNPSQTQTESAWIASYEVEIQDAKGKKLFSDYVMGDFVGIRAQVITIDWPYQLLGFSHLYRLELVHNGYATAQRHQFFPHMAKALPFSAKFFEKLWYQLFIGSWKVPGVKSSTLESAYFPLREAKLKASSRQYDLVVGATGLSARSAQQTVS